MTVVLFNIHDDFPSVERSDLWAVFIDDVIDFIP